MRCSRHHEARVDSTTASVCLAAKLLASHSLSLKRVVCFLSSVNSAHVWSLKADSQKRRLLSLVRNPSFSVSSDHVDDDDDNVKMPIPKVDAVRMSPHSRRYDMNEREVPGIL